MAKYDTTEKANEEPKKEYFLNYSQMMDPLFDFRLEETMKKIERLKEKCKRNSLDDKLGK